MTMPFQQHASPEREPRPAHVEFAGERLSTVDKGLASIERALTGIIGMDTAYVRPLAVQQAPETVETVASEITPEGLHSSNPLYATDEDSLAKQKQMAEDARTRAFLGYEADKKESYDQKAA